MIEKIRKILYFSLCIFFIITGRSVRGSNVDFTYAFSKHRQGKKLIQIDPLKIVEDIRSSVQCVDLCLRYGRRKKPEETKKCVAVNFSNEQKICELLPERICDREDLLLKNDIKFSYFDMEPDMNQFIYWDTNSCKNEGKCSNTCFKFTTDTSTLQSTTTILSEISTVPTTVTTVITEVPTSTSEAPPTTSTDITSTSQTTSVDTTTESTTITSKTTVSTTSSITTSETTVSTMSSITTSESTTETTTAEIPTTTSISTTTSIPTTTSLKTSMSDETTSPAFTTLTTTTEGSTTQSTTSAIEGTTAAEITTTAVATTTKSCDGVCYPPCPKDYYDFKILKKCVIIITMQEDEGAACAEVGPATPITIKTLDELKNLMDILATEITDLSILPKLNISIPVTFRKEGLVLTWFILHTQLSVTLGWIPDSIPGYENFSPPPLEYFCAIMVGKEKFKFTPRLCSDKLKHSLLCEIKYTE